MNGAPAQTWRRRSEDICRFSRQTQVDLQSKLLVKHSLAIKSCDWCSHQTFLTCFHQIGISPANKGFMVPGSDNNADLLIKPCESLLANSHSDSNPQIYGRSLKKCLFILSKNFNISYSTFVIYSTLFNMIHLLSKLVWVILKDFSAGARKKRFTRSEIRSPNLAWRKSCQNQSGHRQTCIRCSLAGGKPWKT